MSTPADRPGPTPEQARHHIANLLYTYTGIADRKDIDAAVALLGDSTVTFPAGGYDHADDAAPFFQKLWSAPTPHRHDVTNLIVHRSTRNPLLWSGAAHYTRWLLTPEPVLATLGEYHLTVDDNWSLVDLTVQRTWTKG